MKSKDPKEVLAAIAAERRKASEDARRAKRRVEKAAPRRIYLTQDNMRIAFMAGGGKSGGEIAEAIGGTTRHRISALLSRFGLKLYGRKEDEVVVLVRVEKKALDRITHAAVDRDVEVGDLAGRLLSIIGSEAALLKNLLDDEDA